MRPHRDQAGSALLLAIFALVIGGVIAQAVLAVARGQATAGRVDVERLAVEARLDGAIDRAIFALLDQEARDGLAKTPPVVDGPGIALRISDVCGRWDLNSGDLEVLRGLLDRVAPASTELVLSEVREARDAGDGFVVVDQFRALPSVDADTADALAPDLTVHCRAAEIDPDFASTRLLAVTPPTHLRTGPRHAFEIVASGANGPGTRVERTVVVAMTLEPGRAWRVVSWQTGP
jgi:hypothetical protein